MARPGDLVLIAGKGHETYQEFATETIKFDDRLVAKRILTDERVNDLKERQEMAKEGDERKKKYEEHLEREAREEGGVDGRESRPTRTDDSRRSTRGSGDKDARPPKREEGSRPPRRDSDARGPRIPGKIKDTRLPRAPRPPRDDDRK